MRKMYLLLFLSFALFGATGFLVNGDSVVTITLGASIFVQGYLEGGDSVGHFAAYVDLDSNGVVDPLDPVVMYHHIIDGGWEDIDETVNSFVSTIGEAIPVSGNFIYTVTDAVGSDQVILHVQPLSSSLSISGLISPDTAGVAVMTGPLPMGPQSQPVAGDVTDQNGLYSINIPASLAGRYFKIITATFNEVLPDYLGAFSSDSVLVTGDETLNDSLIPTDGALLGGVFEDENGSSYTDPIGYEIRGQFIESSGSYFCMKLGHVTGGSGTVLLHSGSLDNAWLLNLTQQYNPYYMTPKVTGQIQFGYPPDTLLDAITVFSCDTAIAGTVFVDGSVADGVGVWAISDSTGIAPGNGTYSSGYYEILVSSYADYYSTGLSDYDSSMYGGYKIVPPGSTGVNFYVTTSGIEEKEIYSILKTSQSIITASTVLEVSGVTKKDAELKIYNVSGNLVESILQESLTGTTGRYKLNIKNLPTGIFFGKIEGQEGTLKLTVIK